MNRGGDKQTCIEFHESPIKAPVVKTVVGVDAENITVGWRFPGAASPEQDLLDLTSEILYNGQAGLIDVDLLQQQKVLRCSAGTYGTSDYNAYVVMGYPKEGQTLDQVKDLMLGEIAKLKKGEFKEDLLKAAMMLLITTAFVLALPTSSAPPLTLYPKYAEMEDMMNA